MSDQKGRFVIVGVYVSIVFGALIFGIASLAKQCSTLSQPNVYVVPPTEQLLALTHDQTIVNHGRALFEQWCINCHGIHAQGGTGPNLTDKVWLHGSSPQQVYRTVYEGFPQRGMPAWSSLLDSHQIRSVVVYVLTLQR